MVVSENGYTPQDGQFWRKKLGRNREGPVDLELQWDHGHNNPGSQWMVKTTWHGLAKLWRGDLDTVTLCHNPAIYIYIHAFIYTNQLAVRIFQKNTSAVRIFQNAKQFELEYSETLAVRIFQNHMNSFDAHKHLVFFPFCCCAPSKSPCTVRSNSISWMPMLDFPF